MANAINCKELCLEAEGRILDLFKVKYSATGFGIDSSSQTRRAPSFPSVKVAFAFEQYLMSETVWRRTSPDCSQVIEWPFKYFKDPFFR